MDVIVWAVKQNCLKINTDVHINVFTVIGKIKKKEQQGRNIWVNGLSEATIFVLNYQYINFVKESD